MNEKTDDSLKCLIVIVTWIWMMDLYVQSPLHYIREYYTYIYSYIYIHNQQFKSRIKQKIFHWCCQKNECGKHQRAIVQGLFVFHCRKIRLWILIFFVRLRGRFILSDLSVLNSTTRSFGHLKNVIWPKRLHFLVISEWLKSVNEFCLTFLLF